MARVSAWYASVGLLLIIVHAGLNVYFLVSFSDKDAIGYNLLSLLYTGNVLVYLIGLGLLLSQTCAFYQKLNSVDFEVIALKQMALDTASLLILTLFLNVIYYAHYVYDEYFFDQPPYVEIKDLSIAQ